ncbi:MAG: hypothetical protein Q9227_005180 [Pyrenula ochraceoflavens]
MAQYGLVFGFREPYQVLVTTSFLRATHRFHMPLHTSLQNTLHGQIKPFITKCSLAALSTPASLDKPAHKARPAFLPPPTDLPLRHCTHHNVSDAPLPEAECLLDHLSGGALSAQALHSDASVPKSAKNKEHFVLASADEEAVEGAKLGKRKRVEEGGEVGLRSLARKVPGVPIVFVQRSVMVLEDISGTSEGVRRREEGEKVGKVKRKTEEEGEGEESAGNEDVAEGRGAESEPSKRKRRRGPKEPNPLSVKKKKVKEKPIDDTKMQKISAGPLGQEEPKKRRRRHRKAANGTEGQATAIEGS